MLGKIKTWLLALDPDVLESIIMLGSGIIVIVIGILLILALKVTLWTTI